MREIKFRAWDEINKIMFNVDSIFFKGCYEWRFSHFKDTTGATIGPDDYGVRGIRETSTSLMQYTGLKDKNGKEMYEGDVVSYPTHIYKYDEDTGQPYEVGTTKEKREIVYDPPSFKYEPFGIISNQRGTIINMVEVIGNIYENPELLEGE